MRRRASSSLDTVGVSRNGAAREGPCGAAASGVKCTRRDIQSDIQISIGSFITAMRPVKDNGKTVVLLIKA